MQFPVFSPLLTCCGFLLYVLDQVTPREGDVRLAGSTSDNSGRVEIYYEGQWGTICDHYWSYYDATVICRQLGYDGVETYYSGSMFGQGSGAIMRNLGCLGKEWFWHDCPFSDWETLLCTHSEDAAVTCSTSGMHKIHTGIVLISTALPDGQIITRVFLY